MTGYQYIDKDGEHLHTLDGAPLYGTSTVIKEVMPPFLAKWGAQCAVDYIKENGTSDAALEEAVSAWAKVRDRAAEKGTDLHARLEKYCEGMILKNNGVPEVWEGTDIQEFTTWASKEVRRFLLAEANVYSREVWVGGIMDCLAELNTGELSVIDFKSSREAYFNQFVQAAGYALQFEENGAFDSEGNRVMDSKKIDALIVIPFGAPKIAAAKITNMKGFQETFRYVVEVYKIQSEFKSNTRKASIKNKE